MYILGGGVGSMEGRRGREGRERRRVRERGTGRERDGGGGGVNLVYCLEL